MIYNLYYSIYIYNIYITIYLGELLSDRKLYNFWMADWVKSLSYVFINKFKIKIRNF